MYNEWEPPVRLFRYGRQKITSRNYYNDASITGEPKRVLIKRTLCGEGVLYAGNQRLTLPLGSMMVIERPGPYVYCYEGDGTPWEFEYITISFTTPGDLIPGDLKSNPVWQLKNYPWLAEEHARMVDIAINSKMEGLPLSGMAYRFYLACLTVRLQEKEKSHPVSKLKTIIDKEFSRELNLARIAENLDFTQEGLSRAFTKEYGIPPIKYLLNLRINKARRLLEEGELPLKKISSQCGFSTPNYFGRVFKTITGLTPGQYRANPDPLLSFHDKKQQ